MNRHNSFLITLLILASAFSVFGQTLKGKVMSEGKSVPFAQLYFPDLKKGTLSDSLGWFEINQIPTGNHTIQISALGFFKKSVSINFSSSESKYKVFELIENPSTINEVVISGTMKEVSKLESAVPIDVYTHCYFEANPTPSIFESLQNVNGVRPQLNCNICNTGDIHINGLEGPYTMVLIDGMPIVSGLSTVYGLTGIPQSLIDRVEIVKGPASTLYGSEAVGGVINIITKRPKDAPIYSVDVFSTDWGDVNTDLGIKFKAGSKANSILGVNYFHYQNPKDENNDGFTDITLQKRASIFNKWTFDRKQNRLFSVAGRLVFEDRYGGQMNWNPQWRGSDSIYGESIYTNRWELIGAYQLPMKEKVMFQWSANGHCQDSYYGTTSFQAQQYIGFGQLVWNKTIKKSDFTLGTAYRFTWLDDNTPATSIINEFNQTANNPSVISLPGIFLQNEHTFNEQHKLLLGIRYDYNFAHGSVWSPRINYKLSSKNKKNVLRFSVGNGFRVANVFTEDHAALTGARTVVFKEFLNPEKSWNANINGVKKIITKNNTLCVFDASAFYTYFDNRIVPDYLTNPNQIIYTNLNGFAVSKGISLNMNLEWANGLKLFLGSTFMDVSITQDGIRQRQILTERFSGVWNLAYTFSKQNITIHYTGNLYGPMLLPLLSEFDDRAEESPYWSIQNIQITKKFAKGIEIYGGVKNLLNFTPPANSIARAFDPFDKNVQFDAQGQVIPTADNPKALTFDPTYMFAPNQGIRMFLGFRWNFYKNN